jgi:DNA-directed RNA polymerase subunit RPC12/RpoP
MRYACFFCGKSVTSELPNDSVIRALLICPECMEDEKIIIPESETTTVENMKRRSDGKKNAHDDR